MEKNGLGDGDTSNVGSDSQKNEEQTKLPFGTIGAAS
jgi:hypothetical protein